MGYTNGSTARISITKRIMKLTNASKDILKQYQQMDLENNEVDMAIYELVLLMVVEIENLKAELSAYTFE